MTAGPEHDLVESPFLDQLSTLGWKINTGRVDNPTVSGRESFKKVFLEDDLRKALRRINPGPDNTPWLDDERLSQAIAELERIAAPKLIEANQTATDLLQTGITVQGLPDWDGGRDQSIRYIDWDNPENNTFRAINQFRVDEPGGQAKKYICPDIVLFVNGIPLVVVECKSPYASDPVEEGIVQLQRYANGRDWAEGNEGNEALFRTNALLIHTHRDLALVGTIGSPAVHYKAWKDTAPIPREDVAKQLGVNTLHSQQLLIAGMLRKDHLLDLVRHFLLYMNTGGRTIKVVARYQQFRAVRFALERLQHGNTRAQDGEHDRRGGIIWHTQGSGKSLTMVFLVRAMRSNPDLRKFKVVVVTDRTSLQSQLADTAELSGEPVTVCKTVAQVKKALATKGPGLVFAMIQKYRDGGDEIDADAAEDGIDESDHIESFGQLNDDDSILVMVDEAHRSHGSGLHANLLEALPNCARIGFTGTPIIMGAKKRTHQIFGDYIDKYTIRQAEADNATVPILYEGRTTRGAVCDGRDLDEVFEDMFIERSEEELERIKKKYATKGHVMEAKALIAAKARDMLRHYVANVLPNGYKAQVVAHSRKATLRYRDAFLAARDQLVADIEAQDPAALALDDEQADALPRAQQFLRTAHRLLPRLRELDFCPVISSGNNDTPDYAPWTDRAKIKERIAAFKRPLVHQDPDKCSPVAFLIVKSMLLTGFDAPVEQVLYLDRSIKEAELLQAIARVNRTYDEKKRTGLVVDYYGVANHLKEALAVYTQDDIQGALESAGSELPKLRDQHLRLEKFFAEHGLAVTGNLSPVERDRVAKRFGSWAHPRVADADRNATLGDGSHRAALHCVERLEALLLAPAGDDGLLYPKLHQKVVSAVRKLLEPTLPGSEHDDAADQLVLQVEPLVFKLLALIEPARYAKLASKKKGLATGLTALIKAGHSRYALNLGDQAFQSLAGWEERSAHDNAVRDVVGDRLHAAHKGAGAGKALWPSSMVMMLGLVDHNLAHLADLPPALDPKAGPRSDQEALDLLRDEKKRAQFHVMLQQFLGTLDTVMPRPEAKPFAKQAKHYSALFERARRLYRGSERPIGKEVGEKVRQLIDDHVVSLGIDPTIPPTNLLDIEFDDLVKRAPSNRAKASEMEHALRHHIRQHAQEDPEHFKKLSERLEEIIEKYEGNWAELAEQLTLTYRAEREHGRQEDDTGLDPKTQAPFFGLIAEKLGGREALSPDVKAQLREVTIALVDQVREQVGLVNFWQRPASLKALRAKLVHTLDDAELVPWERVGETIDELLELAKHNHDKLVS